ncbi:Uncharacterized protein APZ42_003281, partial [Daphnia magna]
DTGTLDFPGDSPPPPSLCLPPLFLWPFLIRQVESRHAVCAYVYVSVKNVYSWASRRIRVSVAHQFISSAKRGAK